MARTYRSPGSESNGVGNLLTDKIAPHSLETERAVLGALLLERDVVGHVLRILTPEDFFLEGHRRVFAAVAALAERSEAIDILTVCEQLKRHDELEEIGGPAALAVMAEEAATASNVVAYSDIIRNKAVARELIAISADTITKAYQNGRPAGDLLMGIDARLERIRDRSLDEGTVLLDAQLHSGPRQLVEPLVEATGITILFADGGAGKGYIALIVAIAGASGKAMPAGIHPTRRVPVLLLDYESTRADVERRLALLGRGLEMETAGLIHYRHCTRPLAEDLGVLRMEVARRDVGLLIVDSFAPACGPEPETGDAIIRTMAAMRSLGVPCLVVAHVSKAMADQTGRSRPFGSVFAWNLARSCWEVKRTAETEAPGELTLALYHAKVNEGPRRDAFGVRLIFNPPGDHATAVSVEACPLSAAADLVQRLTLADRILQALERGAMTTDELAKTIAAPDETVPDASVAKALQRLKDRKLVVKLDDGGGRGHPARWGRAAR